MIFCSPTNPEGLTALWVGNVLPTVKETDLQNLFNRFEAIIQCARYCYCHLFSHLMVKHINEINKFIIYLNEMNLR